MCILAGILTVFLASQAPITTPTTVKDETWEALSSVTRRASYIVTDRDSLCWLGHIKRVDETSLTLKTWTGEEKKYVAAQVRAVMPASQRIVYSGKSSWADVMRLSIGSEVKIITSQAEEVRGKLVEARDNLLAIRKDAKQATPERFERSAIARVFQIIDKPLSDTAERASTELIDWLFVPELWPRILRIPNTMPLRVYDTSLPDDPTPFVCKSTRGGIESKP
jgi:hypothetical protein